MLTTDCDRQRCRQICEVSYRVAKPVLVAAVPNPLMSALGDEIGVQLNERDRSLRTGKSLRVIRLWDIQLRP